MASKGKDRWTIRIEIYNQNLDGKIQICLSRTPLPLYALFYPDLIKRDGSRLQGFARPICGRGVGFAHEH